MLRWAHATTWQAFAQQRRISLTQAHAQGRATDAIATLRAAACCNATRHFRNTHALRPHASDAMIAAAACHARTCAEAPAAAAPGAACWRDKKWPARCGQLPTPCARTCAVTRARESILTTSGIRGCPKNSSHRQKLFGRHAMAGPPWQARHGRHATTRRASRPASFGYRNHADKRPWSGAIGAAAGDSSAH
jgi:hypothetical protein